METRNLICIGCPMGCPLTVTVDGESITVSGNTCPHGAEYAKKEVTNPTRVVTSSVGISGAAIARVSVKTASDIPKDKIFDCMREIRGTAVKAPVRIGDIIIRNCAGTGVDVIATKNVPAVSESPKAGL
ncbi:MAG: DUF1667 domain-containing protein [Clostridiales bacterium]|nr:DUF1667 domain-containing protein [Clostridiales bacterium]